MRLIIILIAVLSIIVSSISVFAATPVNASANYPDHAVTLIDPFLSRAEFGKTLAESAPHFLKQPVLIEGKYGANGTVAATTVQHATPDGYTLLLGRIATQIIQPSMHPETPYRWNDFTVIAILEIDPLICAMRKELPYRTTRELLDGIRKHPGTLKYSTAGLSTNTHLGVQYMLHLAGLKPGAAVPVHYDGGTPAIQALLDGKVHFACVAGGLIPYIKSGELRGLMTTAPGRLVELPELPNATEAGLRDMGRIVGWTGLFGPANLPPEVVTRWQETLSKVAHDPDWITSNARQGGLPAVLATSDPERFMRDQYTLYDQLINMLELNK